MVKTEPVNLVVADLKMPRMDGLTLLGHLSESYPDIPVIIITGYGTPETERMARAGGAEDFLEKPFMVAKLAHKVCQILKNISDGGTLHDVSPTMFLQLIEVEQKTCTVRLNHAAAEDRRQGVLFFKNGELMDARLQQARGRDAALELLAWDQVSLAIQTHCPITERRIDDSVQGILMESLRRKDEDLRDEVGAPESEEDLFVGLAEEPEPEPPDRISELKTLLEAGLGRRSGVRGIYEDPAWGGTLSQLARLGTVFKAGDMQLGYINNGMGQDYILITESDSIVVAVDPKCPRDRIMQLLIRERE
jgi:CheY-like chemotaxis protein